MKNILAFGDSLTWGAVALKSLRHPFDVRWPNVLAAGLGGKARVIEEGLNGRTTVFPDPTEDVERNGAVALPMLLKTHEPLDLIIIMLGTNDIKYANRCRAFDASMGMSRLIGLAKRFPYNENYASPKILIMNPPHLVKTDDEWFNDLWGHAIEESKLLPKHYARVAQEEGVHFFDTNAVAKCDPTDGGHLDSANTAAIGMGLVPVVKKILEI
ncbi:SGNH/GDSL hydrolase family protein [Aestuariivirga litoralis]|uniref:SGNH/GDSL hydrolase family protein n=1 Tax=Aestuariivirga litoralis TaxID=2650924 RepID=UPI0018C51997|nr:SGNH/GDSL hydrolase family protein [Aestuariivirga litoralis]MBG1231560.1 SGNH/GDSL hydrolase family protein [Aestuariivirga litoralis]